MTLLEAIEAHLLANGWTHCRCNPPWNWARDDSEHIMCWPIAWAIHEQFRLEGEDPPWQKYLA